MAFNPIILDGTVFGGTVTSVNDVAPDDHGDVTLTQADLPGNRFVEATSVGVPGGVAELDENGLLLASQVPGGLKEIDHYDSAGDFPFTGDEAKLYLARDTHHIWLWDGLEYVDITATGAGGGLTLGETDATAYRGDRGASAWAHSQISGNPHGTTKTDIGLGNVDNTEDTAKPVSTAQSSAISSAASGARTEAVSDVRAILAADYLKAKVVDSLPAVPAADTIYLVRGA